MTRQVRRGRGPAARSDAGAALLRAFDEGDHENVAGALDKVRRTKPDKYLRIITGAVLKDAAREKALGGMKNPCRSKLPGLATGRIPKR